jgi:type I restriction-modification system DNA methylase subunit
LQRRAAAGPAPAAPVGTPEAVYAARADRAYRKAWGQFFTPPEVAELMADWLAETAPARICDPAAGTGVLVRAVRARLPQSEILAVEKDPRIAAAADLGPETAATTPRQADFLTLDTAGWDGFIANPPFIRHRHLADYGTIRTTLGARTGFDIAKNANLYLYFCAKILADLAPGGRAALLLPGEWMNANFAQGFKTHLHASGALRQIVAFANSAEVFDDALTTASLLLLQRPADNGR